MGCGTVSVHLGDRTALRGQQLPVPMSVPPSGHPGHELKPLGTISEHPAVAGAVSPLSTAEVTVLGAPPPAAQAFGKGVTSSITTAPLPRRCCRPPVQHSRSLRLSKNEEKLLQAGQLLPRLRCHAGSSPATGPWGRWMRRWPRPPAHVPKATRVPRAAGVQELLQDMTWCSGRSPDGGQEVPRGQK